MNRSMLRKGCLWLLLTGLIGCSAMSGPYGSINPDKGVQQKFDAYQMEPEMNYYYSGPDAYPNAIIGLRKQFVLDNNLWKPIAPNPEIFKRLIQNMQDKARWTGAPQFGFIMKDHQGQPIGVWYSILSIKTMVVKMGKDNLVNVYTPELFIYPRDKWPR